jgi:putative ABC transport system ATP-binding protein
MTAMAATRPEAPHYDAACPPSTAVNAAVVFKKVAKTYRVGATDVPALKEITLKVPFHRFTTLIGASGSGKSTLLNLAGCIDTPTRGTVEVYGEDVAALDTDAVADFRAKNIGFIFQNFSLVPVLTAYENVEYPLLLIGMQARERRERTLDMLAAVGLMDHAEQRPNQLSGGQKQRVAIARALVKRPLLVLADEPTANLDSGTGASILNLMRQVQAESRTTFIFASHDPQLISNADDIFSIRDGEIVEHRTGAKS